MLTDVFGNELNVGDYVYSTKSNWICYAIVISITPYDPTTIGQGYACGQLVVVCSMNNTRLRTHWSWWQQKTVGAVVLIKDEQVPQDIKNVLQKRAIKEWRKK